MGEMKTISPLEDFFRRGGMATVLRSVPMAHPARESEDNHVLSLGAFREFYKTRPRPRAALESRERVRKAVSRDPPDLVLIAPDRAACGTVRQRDWPLPVIVPELAAPPLTTEEGWIIREVYETFRNVPLKTYLASSSRTRMALTRWASAASLAIERALRVRVVHRGRIVVCGGDPFIGLIAAHLVPKSTYWNEHTGWMQTVLNEPVENRSGFTVHRSGTLEGVYDLRPLVISPPHPPREAMRLVDSRGTKR